MTAVRVVPFRRWHLEAIGNRDGDMRDALGPMKESDPSWTLVDDLGPVAAGGIILPWPGVGLCWMSLSGRADRHMIRITGIARKVLHATMEELDLHRLEAVVLREKDQNLRWIEHLGFRPENGMARAYTPDGRDAIRYEIVR